MEQIVEVPWDKVCRPKDRGSLGIVDIATHNKALLVKNVHKLLNRMDIPWVSLLWETAYNNSIPNTQKVGS